MTGDPSATNAIGARTMADAAAEQLHELILSGAIPAGHPLRLTVLAERLGMSQMPVREALRRLNSLGLVEMRPHRGAFVRELSEADLRDTIETRLILEQAAIERGAARFGEDNAEEATRWLRRHESLLAAGLAVEAREAHTQFHFALYRASRSRWLVHAIEPVFRNSERYRFVSKTDPSDHRSDEEHQAILRACIARDAGAAGRALVDHLDRAARRMLANVHDGAAASEDASPSRSAARTTPVRTRRRS